MARKIFTPEQIIRKLREAEVLIAESITAQQAARQVGYLSRLITDGARNKWG